MSDQHRPCGMSAFAPSGNCWRPSQWNALFSTKTLVGEDFQTTSTQHSPSLSPVPCRLIFVGALDVSSMCAAAADLRDPGFMHGVAPGQPAPCASACRRHPCSLSRCMIIFAFPGRTHTVGTFVLAVAGDKLSQPLICFERLPFSIVYLS